MTMPDERHPRNDAASSPESTEPASDAPVKKSVAPAGDGPASESVESASDAPATRAAESAGATPNDGYEPISASAPRPAQATSPLITAIEIENFKGIGRPVRIDLRPITLLFGNNSTGKSTVLHALCYAHEILSHRNVDVHETEIGGDQIDLGGFGNLVHAHDPARPVRLRFELNLEDWRIPQGLDEKIESPLGVMGGNADWSLFHGSERPSSGWIELQARLTDDQQPVLSSYELSVNDARVGRLLRRQPTGVSLEFDPTHPLLERSLRPRRVMDCNIPEGTTEVPEADRRASRVRESTGADGGGWKECRMEVLGLFTPLPHWNEIPLLGDHGQSDASGYDLDEFTAMVSALFVGIGQALRDELARVRYIGPVRDLHPKTTIASSARRRAFETFAADFIHGGGASGTRPAYPASWADGSAAWIYLHDTPHRTLLDEVNTWLERRDRLDTGYALRVRSKVTIYEDEAGVLSEMREYHQLRQTFGNAEGSVDLAAWSRAEAAAMVDTIDPDGTKAALGHCDQLREIFAGAAEGTSIAESVDELAREVLQDIIEKFESIDIKPGIRREAERNLRLAEDLRRLLTLSTQEIESQFTGAGEDMADSSEKLTDAYCRRLSDLLRRWEGDAPKWIYMAGIVDGLRAMFGRDDLPDEIEAWTRKMEDSRDQAAVSGEVEQFLGEFRAALQASVASANRNYRRLTALVAKMEGGRLSSPEVDKLAAALAARQPQREVDLVTTRNRLPVRVPDVGVGISQILPVVVAALDPQRPGITAIEQPELHLHPKLQVELGDLFAQPVNDGRIFLLENHSEHMMLRLLRRIEETHSGELPEGKPALKPSQVSVVFLEQVDGEVQATRLRIDETGEFIDRWPQGFFDERDDELF